MALQLNENHSLADRGTGYKVNKFEQVQEGQDQTVPHVGWGMGTS